MSQKTYKALFFDADKTLLDFVAAEKRDWNVFLKKRHCPDGRNPQLLSGNERSALGKLRTR